jgi:hypothetical protein
MLVVEQQHVVEQLAAAYRAEAADFVPCPTSTTAELSRCTRAVCQHVASS